MQVQSVTYLGNIERTARSVPSPRRTVDTKTSPVPAEKVGRIDEPVLRDQPETGDTSSLVVGAVDGDKTPGVIRLLEAGHFRGVADVRLRINFFDQLAARAKAVAQPAVERESRQLVDTVTSKVDELIGQLAADVETQNALDGLVVEFDSAVQAATRATGFSPRGSTAPDLETLEASLRTAFGELVDQMTQLLAAPADESPPPTDAGTAQIDTSVTPVSQTKTRDFDTDDTAKVITSQVRDSDIAHASPVSPDEPESSERPNPANPSETTPSPEPAPDTPAEGPGETLDDAIASLVDAFNEALASLLASVDSATRLPDPTPPRGNGVAYDKFLAIYNELRGATGTVEETA